jgi:hypothetical protein
MAWKIHSITFINDPEPGGEEYLHPINGDWTIHNLREHLTDEEESFYFTDPVRDAEGQLVRVNIHVEAQTEARLLAILSTLQGVYGFSPCKVYTEQGSQVKWDFTYPQAKEVILERFEELLDE